MAEAFGIKRFLCGWRIIPPVITCFRRVFGAHGSERATAAVETRRHPPPRARGMARMQKPRRWLEPLGAAGSAAAGSAAGEGIGGNVRTGPGVTHRVLTRVPQGATFPVLATKQGWHQRQSS